MERQVTQTNLNREMLRLTGIINQRDLRVTYRPFYPNTKEYAFFSALDGILIHSKIDHTGEHKASVNR